MSCKDLLSKLNVGQNSNVRTVGIKTCTHTHFCTCEKYPFAIWSSIALHELWYRFCLWLNAWSGWKLECIQGGCKRIIPESWKKWRKLAIFYAAICMHYIIITYTISLIDTFSLYSKKLSCTFSLCYLYIPLNIEYIILLHARVHK